MMSTEERVKILREAGPDTWIAFSADESRVVATGDSYAEAVKMANEKGELAPVLTKTPENWNARVFSPTP
jgi:predicted RNase H-like HicB family nuclease